jgi:DNA-binding response OmpR family regulator
MAGGKSAPTILIIEDNQDLVEMYRLKLSLEGFQVETATDGEKGILAAVETKPDMILLDILMPNMNGFEVLKALRNNTKLDTKIIVLSNLGQYENIKEAKDLGATEYMVKANTTPTMVVAKIKELLGIEQTPKEAEQGSVAQASQEKDSDEIIAEKLERYKKLLDEGVITQQEFDEIKKKLLFE